MNRNTNCSETTDQKQRLAIAPSSEAALEMYYLCVLVAMVVTGVFA
jgi:hypothetical protein